MKLIIDIPEEDYEIMKHNIASNNPLCPLSQEEMVSKVANGIPLSKGHGDLKDFQKMYADMTEKEELARQRVIDTPTNSPCYLRYVAQLNERTAFKEMLYDAPTIIEADKGSEGVDE